MKRNVKRLRSPQNIVPAVCVLPLKAGLFLIFSRQNLFAEAQRGQCSVLFSSVRMPSGETKKSYAVIRSSFPVSALLTFGSIDLKV
jgi:hypothetical protein